jgi:hypothetical protein
MAEVAAKADTATPAKSAARTLVLLNIVSP